MWRDEKPIEELPSNSWLGKSDDENSNLHYKHLAFVHIIIYLYTQWLGMGKDEGLKDCMINLFVIVKE